MTAQLPIQEALPALLGALAQRRRAVLQAPPGAGKTTVVPLEMLRAGFVDGRILMLEPRRLAARAAAERMAETLGETAGRRVGYRMRGAARVSAETRIEIVTEGILTRMIQSDPGLPGIGAVIFDEFHERSLNADLGLALCLEIAGALRGDLMLVAMSATLDADPVAELMDAPVVTSAGRSFPVEIRHLDRPSPERTGFDAAMADLIARAVRETEGGVLAFLPGEGEIRRVEALLRGRLPRDCSVRPLFGAMPFERQRAAIAPEDSARKVVLATSIAETSLTIEGVRVVVDGCRARRSRFDAASGMSRLVTVPATRAETAQRAGRAGRTAPGLCYRLRTKGEEGAAPAHPPAEIEAADLTGFALELALWGGTPEATPLLTQPSSASYAEAQALLRMLGALDAQDRITDHGRTLAALPLHPRLAHMLATAGPAGAEAAALLSSRDPLARGAPVDLALRLQAVRGRAGPHAADRGAVAHIRKEAARLARQAKDAAGRRTGDVALPDPDRADLHGAERGAAAHVAGKKPRRAAGASPLGMRDAAPADPDRADPHGAERGAAAHVAGKKPRQSAGASPQGISDAALAALAYPDRVGLRRDGNEPRYLLSGGKGAVMPDGDPLGAARLIVATDLDGDPTQARIRQAIPIAESELRSLFAGRIAWRDACFWDRRERRVAARRQERFGVIVLDDRVWKDAPAERIAEAMLDGVRSLGLNWSAPAKLFAARVGLLREAGADLPDMSDTALLESLEDWLLPFLGGVASARDWKRFDMLGPLRAMLDHGQMRLLDRDCPAQFETPLGRRIAIDYSGEHPGIAVRLQEMFGQRTHPQTGGRPFRITLLSPAGRPVQTTLDLPGFWRESYADVRKDMRGRYPKHPWPEDPAESAPTLRAKARRR